MGDLKKRASFARVVNYVNNPKKARIIDSKDVRLCLLYTSTRTQRDNLQDAQQKTSRLMKNLKQLVFYKFVV